MGGSRTPVTVLWRARGDAGCWAQARPLTQWVWAGAREVAFLADPKEPLPPGDGDRACRATARGLFPGSPAACHGPASGGIEKQEEGCRCRPCRGEAGPRVSLAVPPQHPGSGAPRGPGSANACPGRRSEDVPTQATGAGPSRPLERPGLSVALSTAPYFSSTKKCRVSLRCPQVARSRHAVAPVARTQPGFPASRTAPPRGGDGHTPAVAGGSLGRRRARCCHGSPRDPQLSS